MSRFATPLKFLTGLWMTLVAVAMFVWVPAHNGLGNVGRIVIVHVPTGWLAAVAFLVAAVYSGLYLRRGRPHDDAAAQAAAELGLLFSVLATVTGSIFARVVWGTFWNWDPRETAIAVLMLIYAAYFALRASIEAPERARRLASVYALLAFVTVPFLIFVIPRITDSTLHPNCAILNTPNCEGLTFSEGGRIQGQVEDFRLKLLALEEQSPRLEASIEVRTPDGVELILNPGYDLASNTGEPVEVPGTRRQVQIKQVRGAPGARTVEVALANVGNLGLLTDGRTLLTFFGSLIGFTALFVWLWRLRTLGLDLREQLQGLQA